ncbi:hypothetical protein B0O99DRAFT_695709 [Bisporella sp. PMI_857]|nr:hypothetical protein B0O99DRAFT_695709 [Bisporella sp. PMI_857]
MPPPKSKKKKSKTSKSSAKEAARHHPRVVHDLDDQVFQLFREWEASFQRKALVQQVEDEINTQKDIFLDNVVCLGLGSLETATMQPLPGWAKRTRTANHNIIQNEAYTAVLQDSEDRFKPVGRGKDRNRGLYQLLVLETVINCLRAKFPIGPVRFQDPNFTKKDQEFLEQRGHTVLEWNGANLSTDALDPQLTNFLSSSTFCYLPCLDLPIVVVVIHAAKPCLYLGSDLIVNTVKQNLLRNKKVKALMDEYESIVLPYDFSSVAAFTGEGTTDDFGFMWKADLENEEVRQRVTMRNNEILEKERRLWSEMDKFLAKKLAEKETKLKEAGKEGSCVLNG